MAHGQWSHLANQKPSKWIQYSAVVTSIIMTSGSQHRAGSTIKGFIRRRPRYEEASGCFRALPHIQDSAPACRFSFVGIYRFKWNTNPFSFFHIFTNYSWLFHIFHIFILFMLWATHINLVLYNTYIPYIQQITSNVHCNLVEVAIVCTPDRKKVSGRAQVGFRLE